MLRDVVIAWSIAVVLSVVGPVLVGARVARARAAAKKRADEIVARLGRAP